MPCLWLVALESCIIVASIEQLIILSFFLFIVHLAIKHNKDIKNIKSVVMSIHFKCEGIGDLLTKVRKYECGGKTDIFLSLFLA